MMQKATAMRKRAGFMSVGYTALWRWEKIYVCKIDTKHMDM